MNDDVRTRLQAARDALAGVVPQLERAEEFCTHCDRRSFKNWDEAQMAKELEAVVRKLEGFISKSALPLHPRVGPEIRTGPKEFALDKEGFYEAPPSYSFGNVAGKELRHLVKCEPFNSDALCRVSVHRESLTSVGHPGSKFCDKCLKIWKA